MNKIFNKIESIIERYSSPKRKFLRICINAALCLISIIATFALAFVPFSVSSNGTYKFTAWNTFTDFNSDIRVVQEYFIAEFAALVLIGICTVFLIVFLFQLVLNARNEAKANEQLKRAIILSSAAITIYTIFSFIFSPINCMLGGSSSSDVSYIPLIMIIVTDLLYALFVGSVSAYRANKDFEAKGAAKKHEKERKKEYRILFLQQLELIIFSIGICILSLFALLSKIIKVTFDQSIVNIPTYVLSGQKLLVNASDSSTQGERVIAYFVFLLFFLTVGFAVMSFVSFVGRSTAFKKVTASSLIISSVSCILVGLFGQYYKIVQTLNKELILEIIRDYGEVNEDLLQYEITSEALIYTYVLLGILVLLFVRKPLTRAAATERRIMELGGTHHMPTAEIKIEDATISENIQEYTPAQPLPMPSVTETVNKGTEEDDENKENKDFDPCPAFTQLDRNIQLYENELLFKQQQLMKNPSLPALISYVVQYARDSRHHLSYSEESVATFFAGLGTTRLTILQGMSGTGKTSLPKIVSEALMSICDIIEVESAWRDKNELLGYYNEFSKMYTPKKFTQALYKACLNTETITFIVLDEMNLSRIEYYFSDFLSLMENEPDKREIKLLNLPIEKTEDGEKKDYLALTNGHTIKIPQNVWFIGTANRDESTYDISDKVYDRAHTMNFDKRAQKPPFYGEPMQARYLTANELMRLFDEAKEKLEINIDNYPVVKKLEELLEPYGISFGNRIAMQIESFVSIYASCFASKDSAIYDAFDIILLSKVVKKLELKNVMEKEELSLNLERIGLKRCASFVLNLKED